MTSDIDSYGPLSLTAESEMWVTCGEIVDQWLVIQESRLGGQHFSVKIKQSPPRLISPLVTSTPEIVNILGFLANPGVQTNLYS